MLASQRQTTEKLESHLKGAPGHALLNKWTEWRETEIAPRRSQIRIEELGEALPHVVMVEFTSPEECLFLLVGSGLVNLQGVELTGLNFYEMAHPDERDLRKWRLHRLEQQPCGSYSIQSGTLAPNTTVYTELLTLPILPDNPGEALRGIAVSTPLVDTAYHAPAQENLFIRVAEEFRFIDIGAGLPQEDAMQCCQTPLSL